MRSDWKTAIFSDLCDITRGASPRPIHEWVTDSGIAWVKISDATAAGSRFLGKTGECIKIEGRMKSVSVFPGDLILSNSATPGIPVFLDIEACIHDGWLLLRNFRGLDKMFAYYLLLHERPALLQQGNGSVFTNLKTEILKNHRVTLPPLSEQRAIAHILGTLDDKIELNRKMNETLEAMARALFKSWFVDFDPVRAKVEGRDTGLPKETADLFPDEFEDSELGEIPKGWKVCSIGEIAGVSTGKRPAIRYPEATTNAKVPLWGGNGPMAFVSEPLFDSPILLTGRVGTLGSIFRIVHESWPSDNTLVLQTKEELAFEYLYMCLNRVDFSSLNRGSTQPLLAQSDLKAQKISYPNFELLQRFHQISDLCFARADKLEASSQTFRVLRDLLLPRLISGELRVPEAEKIAEAFS